MAGPFEDDSRIIPLTNPASADIGPVHDQARAVAIGILLLFAAIGAVVVVNHLVDRG